MTGRILITAELLSAVGLFGLKWEVDQIEAFLFEISFVLFPLTPWSNKDTDGLGKWPYVENVICGSLRILQWTIDVRIERVSTGTLKRRIHEYEK